MAKEEPNRRRGREEEVAPEPKGLGVYIAAVRERVTAILQDPAATMQKVNDWVAQNRLRAIIYAAIAGVLFLTGVGLMTWKIIEIRSRPTVEMAVDQLDYGAYVQAMQTCDRLLGFTPRKDKVAMGTIFYVKGVSQSILTDLSWTKERQSYYRIAASLLEVSERDGFMSGRAADGYLYLGKCYYLSGDVHKSRASLLKALELKVSDPRSAYWYLANSVFYEVNPDYAEALDYCDKYILSPTTVPMEQIDGQLLKTMILLRIGQLDNAAVLLRMIPDLDEFRVMRRFVEGQLALEEARRLKLHADKLASISYFSGGDINTQLAPNAQTPTTPSRTAPVAPSTSSISDIVDPVESLEPSLPLPQTPPKKRSDDSNNDSNIIDAPLSRHVLSNDSIQQVQFFAPDAPLPPSTSGEVANQSRVLSNAPLEIIEIEEVSSSTTAAPMPPAVTVEEIVTDSVAKVVLQTQQDAINKYQDAIKLFKETILLDPGDFAWTATCLLLQGICYEELLNLRHANDFADATAAFEQVIQSFPQRPEATAAEFFLGELAQVTGDENTSMEYYYRALNMLRKNQFYSNAWFTRRDIIARGQIVFDRHVTQKKYPWAFRFLEQWRGVIPDSEYYRNGAFAVARWGDELARLATAAIKDQRENLLRQARGKYKIAGEWFEKLSHYDFAQPNYVRLLWDSAEYYRLGWDYPRAIPMYQRYLQNNVTDRQFEAHLHLGRLFMNLDYLERAQQELLHAIEDHSRHPLVATARLWLARTYYEQNNWDEAKKSLQQNLYSEFAPHSQVYRDSLYLFGDIDYREGNYAQATVQLEDAVALHPNAPQAPEAHYTIALCHLAIAQDLIALRETTVLERPRKELRDRILVEYRAAGEQFRLTERLLASRQDIVNLSQDEKLLMRNSLFGMGQMLMKRGQYDEAALVYNSIAARYGAEPIALYALLQVATANDHLGRQNDRRAALNHAEILLKSLSAANVFPPNFRFTEPEWETLLRFKTSMTQLDDIPIPPPQILPEPGTS